MALGQWLSPQVWAAVVASGWAGLCLKVGKERKKYQDYRPFARDPRYQEVPIPEDPSGDGLMLIWKAPGGGPGTSCGRHS